MSAAPPNAGHPASSAEHFLKFAVELKAPLAAAKKFVGSPQTVQGCILLGIQLLMEELFKMWRSESDSASRLLSLGHFNEAEEVARICLFAAESFGDEDSRYLVAINNLLTVFLAQNKFNEAEQVLEDYVQRKEDKLGADHPAIADALDKIAAMRMGHSILGPVDEASWDLLSINTRDKYRGVELMYMRALAVRKRALGDDHLDVARTLSRLARVYCEQGKYKEAESMCVRSVSILRDESQENRKELINALEEYAGLLFLKKRWMFGFKVWLRAYSIRFRVQAAGSRVPEKSKARA